VSQVLLVAQERLDRLVRPGLQEPPV